MKRFNQLIDSVFGGSRERLEKQIHTFKVSILVSRGMRGTQCYQPVARWPAVLPGTGDCTNRLKVIHRLATLSTPALRGFLVNITWRTKVSMLCHPSERSIHKHFSQTFLSVFLLFWAFHVLDHLAKYSDTACKSVLIHTYFQPPYLLERMDN